MSHSKHGFPHSNSFNRSLRLLAAALVACYAGLTLIGCETVAWLRAGGRWFRDVSEQAGIQQRTWVEAPETRIPLNGHARTRISDLNGDGWEDLIMHSLFPNVSAGIPFSTRVFMSNRDGTFTDVSAETGLAGVQAGFMLFADFDNDGDQDAFAGLDYPIDGEPNNAIYLNDGTGRFSLLPESGVSYKENRRTGTAAAADFDGDGILDLFVGNGNTTFSARDDVYRGLGDGRFERIPDALGDPPLQPSNGSVVFDFDRDGDLDIFVSTYGVSKSRGHNHLWENLGDMRFSQAAYATGVAAQRTGNYWLERTGHGRELGKIDPEAFWIGSNGFGVDAGDIDGDGYLDLYLATISHPTPFDKYREWSDPSQLLLNRPATEATEAGLTGESVKAAADTDRIFVNEFLDRGLPYNEGEIDAAIVDIDADGYSDLAVSRESKYESAYDDDAQKGWFGVMRNRGDTTFEDISMQSGINSGGQFHLMKRASNQSWFDWDHDGDLDLFVGGGDMGGGRPNFLFENLVGQRNSWIAIRLEGDGIAVNRDAIGAEIRFALDGRELSRQVISSRGTYSSQDTRVLHFGFGNLREGITGTLNWPDGTQVRLEIGKDMLNRFWLIRHNEGPRELSFDRS